MIQCVYSRRSKRYSFSPKCPDRLWSRPSFHSIGTVVHSHGLSGRWPLTSICAVVTNGWSCRSTPPVYHRGVDSDSFVRQMPGFNSNTTKGTHIPFTDTPGPQVTSSDATEPPWVQASGRRLTKCLFHLPSFPQRGKYFPLQHTSFSATSRTSAMQGTVLA